MLQAGRKTDYKNVKSGSIAEELLNVHLKTAGGGGDSPRSELSGAMREECTLQNAENGPGEGLRNL